MPQDGPICIVPYADAALGPGARAQIDAIFFEASATKAFADETARAAFRERWLGRYLDRFPDCAFLAMGADGRVAGYLVGSLADPARDPLFADIAFFGDLAEHTARFPAQLHINLAPEARGRGIGGRLIAAFCDLARSRGVTGVHVVTGAASRNRTFYAREGFEVEAMLGGPGQAIVLLGRRL